MVEVISSNYKPLKQVLTLQREVYEKIRRFQVDQYQCYWKFDRARKAIGIGGSVYPDIHLGLEEVCRYAVQGKKKLLEASDRYLQVLTKEIIKKGWQGQINHKNWITKLKRSATLLNEANQSLQKQAGYMKNLVMKAAETTEAKANCNTELSEALDDQIKLEQCGREILAHLKVMENQLSSMMEVSPEIGVGGMECEDIRRSRQGDKHRGEEFPPRGSQPDNSTLKGQLSQGRGEISPNLTMETRDPPLGGREKECYICFKDFSTKKNLRRHIEEVHSSKFLCCSRCEFKTKRKSILDEHIGTNCGRDCITCEICRYQTKWKTDMYKHMIKHKAKAAKL